MVHEPGVRVVLPGDVALIQDHVVDVALVPGLNDGLKPDDVVLLGQGRGPEDLAPVVGVVVVRQVQPRDSQVPGLEIQIWFTYQVLNFKINSNDAIIP